MADNKSRKSTRSRFSVPALRTYASMMDIDLSESEIKVLVDWVQHTVEPVLELWSIDAAPEWIKPAATGRK
jgi:hypothetical protein